MIDINDKVVTDSILKKAITEVLQVVADNTFDFVEYSEDEVKSLFDIEPEKLVYYESLINPDLISENRLWSSKTIADKIAEAIVESNSYADGLITNITSIQLEWCETSLPTTGETNKIYILPVTSGSDTVNTLNIWNSKTSAYVSIGNLEIDLSQYYTKSEMDTKLNDKANKSEVLAVDKVQTVTGSETNDTVYSSKLTKVELNKKVSLDDMTTELDKKINKDSIATTLDDTVTDEQVPSAKAMYTEFSKVSKGFNGVLQEGTLQVPNNNMNELTEPYCYETVIDTSSIANFPPVKKGITRFKLKVEILSPNTGMYRQEIEFQAGVVNQGTWYRNFVDGNWNEWKKLCYTTVEDTSGTATVNDGASGRVSYKVINGIAWVAVEDMASGLNGTQVCTISGLPKARVYVNVPLENVGGRVGTIYSTDGITFAVHKTDMSSGYGSFSYPVAE